MKKILGQIAVRFIKTTVTIAVLLITTHGVSADSVYKTLDGKGKASFSDRPLTKDSEPITMQVTKPDPEQASRLTQEQMESSTYLQRQQQQRLNEEQRKAEQAAAQAQHADRCKRARYRQQVFADGGLLYWLDDQGKRVFYTAQEIEEKRTESTADMENVCGG